ncbi:MAG: PilZ domain-containing protein [Planctomycetota bacterium]
MVPEYALDLRSALLEADRWRDADSVSRLRRFVRFPVRAEGRLVPGQTTDLPSNSMTVHVRDVSRGGVGALSNTTLTAGTVWQFELRSENVVIATMPSFVRYSRRIINGAYLIGFQFGLDASLLMSLGVPSKDICVNDADEEFELIGDGFSTPEEIV